MAPGASISLKQYGAEATARPSRVAVCVRGLGKRIDERVVLRDVNFELVRGSFVSLLGSNGAGKSTLLRVLSTLTSPTAGELELFGEVVGPRASAVRARIGVVAHETMLYRDLTALENVTLHARMHGVGDARGRALSMLEMLNVGDRAHDAVRSLSRGTAQRVAMARALVHGPELLLADEPFTGLDVASRGLVERVLTDLWSAGRTIVMSGHDVEQCLRLSERVLVLERGTVGVDQTSSSVDAAELGARLGGAR